jgi:hypothetical protein
LRTRKPHAHERGRNIDLYKRLPDDAVACDHVDPDFDDFEGAEQDIREEFGRLADND